MAQPAVIQGALGGRFLVAFALRFSMVSIGSFGGAYSILVHMYKNDWKSIRIAAEIVSWMVLHMRQTL